MIQYAERSIGKRLCIRSNTLVNIVNCIREGMVAISGIAEEVALSLDSEEDWYTRYSDAEREKVLKAMQNYQSQVLKVYFFPYNIKGVGIIKKLSPNYIRIVVREKRHI